MGECIDVKNEQFLMWLLEQGKLKVIKSPPPIKTFLLSLYGYESRPPYNIDNIAKNIRTTQDILLTLTLPFLGFNFLDIPQ